MRDGTLIWAEATLNLKEYVAPPSLVEQVASQPAVASESASGTQPSQAGKHTTKSRSSGKSAVRSGNRSKK